MISYGLNKGDTKMVKFDKDGWFINQVISSKVNHEEDHDRLYDVIKSKPDSNYDKSKYTEHGHTTHKNNVEGDFKVIPLSDTKYKGKKFEKRNKKDSGALAIIKKLKNSNKMSIVKILIPK